MSQVVSGESPAGKTIAIAGNIGAGKSSLVEFLTRTYDIKPFMNPMRKTPTCLISTRT